MIVIVWIINDIHIEFNDIHWEGCLHITRRVLQSDWAHEFLHRGTEIGSRGDQTLSPPQQNKMADQGSATPEYVRTRLVPVFA